MHDDAAVLDRARAGDPRAYRCLVEQHGRHVYRLAYRVVGRHEDAEDIVQETFVRAWRRLGRFEARANFGTWLYRIAFNCAVDVLRARRSREVPSTPDSLSDLALPSPAPSAEAMAYGGQLSAYIEGGMRTLTLHERTAFVMRHVHGCSIAEIGSVLDVGPSAAKHAVFRAVRKMRAALAPLRRPSVEP